MTTSIVELSLIEPTSATKCPKQAHQPQHNHGRMDQLKNCKVVGKTVGGTLYKTRGIKQIIMSCGGIVPELLDRGTFSVVTTLDRVHLDWLCGQHHGAYHM